jgi:hypothetical protein
MCNTQEHVCVCAVCMCIYTALNGTDKKKTLTDKKMKMGSKGCS